MRNLASFILITFLFLFACDDEKKTIENTETESMEINPLLSEYKTLKDNMDSAWAQYIKNEDTIIDNMDHILVHIAYSPNYNHSKHRKLTKKIKKLRSIRYNQDNILEQIEKYDNETDELIEDLIIFAEETPDASMAIIGEFIKEMNTINGYLYDHRLEYDAFVFPYNEFINGNRDKLMNMGVKKRDLKEMPVFSHPE